jgi:hypothetical protein
VGAEPAGDATVNLVIEKSLPGGKSIEVHTAWEKGACVRAIADGPGFNRAVYPADATGLKWIGGAIQGSLKVTVKPDPWIPQDGKEIACQVAVSAEVRDGKVTGTYKGTCGGRDAGGAVSGQSAPAGAATIDSADLHVTLDDALDDAQPWKSRIGLDLQRRSGKVVSAVVSPDKTSDWSGKADASKLAFPPGAVTGELSVAMENSPVPYTYQLDGIIVGTFVGGTFTGKVGKRNVKGQFKGSVKPAK